MLLFRENDIMFLSTWSPLKQQSIKQLQIEGLVIKYGSPEAHSLFEARYKLVNRERNKKCCEIEMRQHVDWQTIYALRQGPTNVGFLGLILISTLGSKKILISDIWADILYIASTEWGCQILVTILLC